jgi:hypothetical protein
MLPNLLAREVSRNQNGETSLRNSALAALRLFTEEEKLNIIIRLELTNGLMQQDILALKDQILTKDRILEDNLADLVEKEEQTQRVHDMWQAELDQIRIKDRSLEDKLTYLVEKEEQAQRVHDMWQAELGLLEQQRVNLVEKEEQAQRVHDMWQAELRLLEQERATLCLVNSINQAHHSGLVLMGRIQGTMDAQHHAGGIHLAAAAAQAAQMQNVGTDNAARGLRVDLIKALVDAQVKKKAASKPSWCVVM